LPGKLASRATDVTGQSTLWFDVTT